MYLYSWSYFVRFLLDLCTYPKSGRPLWMFPYPKSLILRYEVLIKMKYSCGPRWIHRNDNASDINFSFDYVSMHVCPHYEIWHGFTFEYMIVSVTEYVSADVSWAFVQPESKALVGM